jgi:hypothetical protein
MASWIQSQLIKNETKIISTGKNWSPTFLLYGRDGVQDERIKEATQTNNDIV